MDRFNFNLFFALDAILQSKKLTEAARRTYLSQPAMSLSLKKLREYFNDELVVYGQGAPRLTALALALKPRVRQMMQTARETLQLKLDFDPAIDQRTLRMTASDVVELSFLGKVYANIVREAPNIDLISSPFTYEPVDVLFREDIDFAIVAEAFALPHFPSEPLFSEGLSCIVWDGSQAIGETMTESEYFAARHAAMYYSAARVRHPVAIALNQLSNSRNIVVRTSVYSALPHMIIGTDLIVSTLTSFAKICAEMLPIRVLPLPVPIAPISFVAQWQGYRTEEPVMRWALDHLRSAAAEHARAIG